MKEYKMFKSSTLKSVELPGNSQLIFDLANKNKTNVCLTANLYTSRYSFPLALKLIRYINDDNITKFGKGTYLNVLYTLYIAQNRAGESPAYGLVMCSNNSRNL